MMHAFSFIIKPNFIGKKNVILDLIIKKHTNDKKFILYPKELKTNFPELYIDV